VLFSFSGPSRNRSPIDYTSTGLQLGYMLGDVKGDGWWRGNLELAGEGFGSTIFRGEGNYIAGGTLWLRYNLVSRSSCGLVPYAQVGGGFVSTDINHGIVGQPFNFNLDLGVGVRYFVGRNWSINLEYRYQHISNAGLNQHNLGINADGPILGVSYFF
jgi:opacity protein-like surface antigen